MRRIPPVFRAGCLALLSLVVSFAVAQPSEVCEELAGFVSLTEDPACSIRDEYPGPFYLPAFLFPFGIPCFAVEIFTRAEDGSKVPLGGGYAGLTLQAARGPLQGIILTPLTLRERGLEPFPDPNPGRDTRSLLTARARFAVELSPDDRLVVKTADAILVSAATTTEQLVVTEVETATGRFAGITGGAIVVLGDSIFQPEAPFVTQLCSSVAAP